MVWGMIGILLDYGLDELEWFFDKLECIQKVMQDLEILSICVVFNLECMVIWEVKWALIYLQFYGYNVDVVFVNCILLEVVWVGGFEQYLD